MCLHLRSPASANVNAPLMTFTCNIIFFPVFATTQLLSIYLNIYFFNIGGMRTERFMLLKSFKSEVFSFHRLKPGLNSIDDDSRFNFFPAFHIL